MLSMLLALATSASTSVQALTASTSTAIQNFYMTDFYQSVLNWDANILLNLQNNVRSDLLDPVMKAITHTVDKGIFWILLSVLLLIIPKTRKMGFCSAVSLVFSIIICNGILKHAFARIRPYEVIDGLKCIVKLADDFSFPSGHTSASFASSVAIFLAADKKQKGFAAIGIAYACLVGFTRLYVGIHYPTDVIVAAVVATLFAIPAYLIGKAVYEALAKAFNKKKKQED